MTLVLSLAAFIVDEHPRQLDSPLCIVLKKSQSSFMGFLPSWPDEGDMDLCLPASPLILKRWPSYVRRFEAFTDHGLSSCKNRQAFREQWN